MRVVGYDIFEIPWMVVESKISNMWVVVLAFRLNSMGECYHFSVV